MPAITDKANLEFRDMEAPGSSVPNEPEKPGIRELFATIDIALASLGVNGAITVKKATLALLTADLAHAADVLAVVYDDPVAAQNGIYAKVGGSGSGSWSLTDIALPSSFATDLAYILAQIGPIEDARADAEASAADADADRIAAQAAASQATSASGAATTAAAQALAALAAAGGIDRYADTYAAALAAVGGWTNGDQVLIFVDETHQGRVALYTVTGGALVFKAEVTKAPNASVRVRAVSTIPADLTSPASLGGVTPANGDLFLLAGEAAPGANGVYLMAGGNLARSPDYDTAAEVPPGLIVAISEGDYAGRAFILNTPGPITLGSTALSFVLLGDTPSLPAAPLTRFVTIGDSITESADFPTTNWVEQMGAALGLTPDNLAEGGDELGDQAGFAMSQLPALGDLFTFGIGTNDVQPSSATNVQKRWLFAQGHLAVLMHLATPVAYPERIAATAMTTAAGTWTALGSQYEGTAAFTSNNGAVKRGTVFGSTVAVFVWLNDSLDGEFTVLIDDETFGPFPAQPTALSGGASVITADGETFFPAVMLFDGLAPKDHVVSVANTGAEGKIIVLGKIAGYDGSAVNGPPVLVGNLYDRGPTGWATGAAGVEERTAYANQIIEENVAICNRLGLERVRLWNWAGTINSLSMLKADELHPDQDGHDALFASGMRTLRQVLIPADEAETSLAGRANHVQMTGFQPKDGTLIIRSGERWTTSSVTALADSIMGERATTSPALSCESGDAFITNAAVFYQKSANGLVTVNASTGISSVASPSGTAYFRLYELRPGETLISTAAAVWVSGLEAASDTLVPVAKVVEIGGYAWAALNMLDAGALVGFAQHLKAASQISVTAQFFV